MTTTKVAHVVFPRPDAVRPVLGFSWDAAVAVARAPGVDLEVLMPIPARLARAAQSRVRRARGARAWPAELERLLLALEPRPTLVPYLPVPGRSLEAAALAVGAHLVARRRAARPAVLHGSFLDQGGYAAVTAGRILGAASIAVAHGTDVRAARGELADAGRRRRALETLRHATQVIAVSSHLGQELARLGARTELVRFTTTAARFPERPRPTSRPREVLFAGHLSRAKGVDVLLEAMVRLGDPEVHLRLIGAPSPDLDVHAEVRRLGLERRVVVEREVPQAELAERYARASCVALPSRAEGFGVVLVEALLVGRPVVGSDLGGIRDIIEPSVGRLVAPDDPPLLAAALDELLERGERGEYPPAALRAKALPMTWESVGPELAALTLELARR